VTWIISRTDKYLSPQNALYTLVRDSISLPLFFPRID